jgi:hypothetical protein
MPALEADTSQMTDGGRLLKTPIDVIGDVHGQYDKLVALLRHLRYHDTGDCWRHPDRTAVFVGDLIDRGPRQAATVDLVRRMVDAGAARCILGNHEFNAIAWATPDPDRPGEHLRRHTPANCRQHEAFLREVKRTSRYGEIIAWFKTLPLWLDLGEVRIVHACWHQASMDVIQPSMGPGQTLTEELIVLGSRKEEPAYRAIENICKGPELELPDGIVFTDRDGKKRSEFRIAWWQQDLSTYRRAARVPNEDDLQLIPDLPLPAASVADRYVGPPVMFGHYWFDGPPAVISDQFACLDYSAANQGPLVAYRWDGESKLSSVKLAWV